MRFGISCTGDSVHAMQTAAKLPAMSRKAGCSLTCGRTTSISPLILSLKRFSDHFAYVLWFLICCTSNSTVSSLRSMSRRSCLRSSRRLLIASKIVCTSDSFILANLLNPPSGRSHGLRDQRHKAHKITRTSRIRTTIPCRVSGFVLAAHTEAILPVPAQNSCSRKLHCKSVTRAPELGSV